MAREPIAAVLLLTVALAGAGPARADKTPEQASKAAYEQVQGKSAGARAQSDLAVAGNPGAKTAPAMTRPAMSAFHAQGLPPLASKEEKHATTPLDRLASQGFNGILLSGLIGLGIGGGFGFLTGRFGEKEGDEA